jgi:hypothetical protein
MTLSVLGASTLGVGKLLARRGRGTTLGDTSFD